MGILTKQLKKFFPIAEFDSKEKSSELVYLMDARDTSLIPRAEENLDTYLSSSHRMDFVGRDFQSSSSSTCCNNQGHFQLDQVSQGPSNLTLNLSKDGTPTTSLGNLFHPHCKKLIPYI